jgi:hypothetical protein
MKIVSIPKHIHSLILTYTATSLINAGVAATLILILLNAYAQGIIFKYLLIQGIFIELIILFAVVLSVSFYLTGQGILKKKHWVGKLILFRYKHSPMTKDQDVKELKAWFNIKN